MQSQTDGSATQASSPWPARTGVTEADIIDFCRERLAHFKCPHAVASGALPKTSTGKVQKFLLREPEWSGRDRRIN